MTRQRDLKFLNFSDVLTKGRDSTASESVDSGLSGRQIDGPLKRLKRGMTGYQISGGLALTRVSGFTIELQRAASRIRGITGLDG